MSVIGKATNNVMATIPVGIYPNTVALTPKGTYAHIANYEIGTVSVIGTSAPTAVPTATPIVAQTPTVPEFPVQLLIITIAVYTIILFSVVIIAKKRLH